VDADVCIPLNSMVIEIEEEVSWGFGGGGGIVLSGLFGGIFGGNGRGMMMRWVLWVYRRRKSWWWWVGWKYTVSRLKNPD